MTELLWWHRAGQQVVCVDDFRMTRYAGLPWLQKDAVYTIAAVLLDDDGNDPFFGLAELKFALPCCGGWPAWAARRFRPVRNTDISQFEALLNPTDEDKALWLVELAEILEREYV